MRLTALSPKTPTDALTKPVRACFANPIHFFMPQDKSTTPQYTVQPACPGLAWQHDNGSQTRHPHTQPVHNYQRDNGSHVGFKTPQLLAACLPPPSSCSYSLPSPLSPFIHFLYLSMMRRASANGSFKSTSFLLLLEPDGFPLSLLPLLPPYWK